MKAAIFFGFCAVCATANLCCDNADKKFCHVACKMYVGECCHLTPEIIKEKPWRLNGRCCCGGMYDLGWNKKCTGEDTTPNPDWFPNPKKKMFLAQKIFQRMKAANPSESGNLTIGQPNSQQTCFMWKDWDGCLTKTFKEGTLPGTHAPCETVSCSASKTCPGAPHPHKTGDWCNTKAWNGHCASGWATGAACQMGASDVEVRASAGKIDLSFADKSYQNIFGEDFSWDQRNDEAKYFDVGNHGGREALRIRVYEGDKTAWKGNPSCPRTELRPRTRDMLTTETDYTAEFEYQLQHYTAPYNFAIMQLYGGAPRNRPNIFLRMGSFMPHKRKYKQQYNILCEQCDKPSNAFEVAGNAAEDIGKWIKWRIEFRLSASSHGHLRFYKNGKQVYTYSGKTSDGSSHNWKTGIYTQGEPDCGTKNTVAYLSNLRVLPTGSAAALNSTNANSAESDADLHASSVLV